MPRKQRKIDSGLKWGEGFINKRTAPDGSRRYQARWPEGSGHRTRWRAKTFKTEDDAEDFLRSIARRKRDGTYTPASDLTIQQLVEQYIDRGAGRWTTNTHLTYRQRAENHIYIAFGSMRATELTTSRVQHWIDTMRRDGSAANHIQGVFRVLTAALHEATRLGIVPTNAAVGVRLPSPKHTVHNTWTSVEVSTVLKDVSTRPMWHALYRLALMTGMRPGEVRALRWGDVNLDHRTVTVRHTITKDHDGSEIMGETTKTRQARSIAIPATCVTALRRWKSEQNERRLASDQWDPRGFVFTRSKGVFLYRRMWQDFHNRLIIRTGVSPITLHEMRHTNATIELASGTHPKLVSDRLGHKKIETTLNLYSHVSAELQRAATDALDDLITRAGRDRSGTDND